MATGTVISRITGFVRDTLIIVAALGNDKLSDAFRIAQTLPTMFYILMVGGVINAVFVPQIVRALKTHPDGGSAYLDHLLSLTGGVLLLLTVGVTLAAPVLVPLWTDWQVQSDIHVAVVLAYWSLPQIFFYGYTSVLSQVLNARRLFGPMTWAPIASNLMVIATGTIFMATVGSIDKSQPTSVPSHGILILGAGTLLAAVVQTLVLLPPLYRSGYRYRPRWNRHTTEDGKILELARWTILFVLSNQLCYLVITRVGTRVTELGQTLNGGAFGYGFSAYTNASMMMIVPHSIVTVSLVTALLPRMSSAALEGDRNHLREHLSQGLRWSAVLLIPTSIVFLTLGPTIGRALYGHFIGLEGSTYVGYILSMMSLGLVAFSAQYLLLRGFYAQEDTRTPFFINLVITGLNSAGVMIAYLCLPLQWVSVGMAAAFCVAYGVGVVVSFLVLRQRLEHLQGRRILNSYTRLFAASLTAGGVAVGVAQVMRHWWGVSVAASFATLLVSGGLTLVLSLMGASLLHVPEVNQFSRAMRLGLPSRTLSD